jgi:hypothetical protein
MTTKAGIETNRPIRAGKDVVMGAVRSKTGAGLGGVVTSCENGQKSGALARPVMNGVID